MILEKIMRHLDMLGLLVQSTQAMISSCNSGKYETVDSIADNRERLINIVRLLQDDIESEIQEGNVHYSNDEMEIFRSWIEDVTNLIAKNADLDEQCLNLLAKAKDSTTQEISSVFKKRKQFQGYNLNNLKSR